MAVSEDEHRLRVWITGHAFDSRLLGWVAGLMETVLDAKDEEIARLGRLTQHLDTELLKVRQRWNDEGKPGLEEGIRDTHVAWVELPETVYNLEKYRRRAERAEALIRRLSEYVGGILSEDDLKRSMHNYFVGLEEPDDGVD